MEGNYLQLLYFLHTIMTFVKRQDICIKKAAKTNCFSGLKYGPAP